MRVLYHVGATVVGGGETHLQYLLKYLPEQVTPLVTFEYPGIEWFIRSLGVPFRRVTSPLTLTHVIHTFRPDVVQFYTNRTACAALGLARVRPAVIEVVHNRHAFPGDCTSYSKRFTDLLVCVSPDAQAWVRSQLPEMDTITIPNGVDTEVFRPPSHRRRRARPLGGFSGRLAAGDEKGLEPLMEIVSRLPVDFELVGKDYGAYGQLSRRYPNIRVLPHMRNIAQKYHEWDFFVSRSPSEGFGLSIAEALACGLPSVIYYCGGICHYIEHGRHALLAYSDEDLEAGIRRIVEGIHLEPTALDLSARGMAVAYVKVYEELIAKLAVQAESLRKSGRGESLPGWGGRP